MRNDPLVRYLEYDPKIDMAYSPAPEKSLNLESRDRFPGYRDASMRPNWLVNPCGYTILTACGPTETAKELIIENGERRGALSYFLLRTFAKLGGIKEKQRHVYHLLCARFRESWPQQNPVLYGNKDQTFFGRINRECDAIPIQIVKKRDGSLQLQAGQAHGVCDGDRFTVSPFGSAEHDTKSLVAEVIHAGALTSGLEPLDTTPTRIQTGWDAKALTRFSLRRFPIRLASDFPRWNQWLTTLKARSLDVHNDDGLPFSFHVILNSNKEYEIRDESDQPITNLPNLKQDQTDATHLCDIIEHLTRFKLVRDLTSKGPVDCFRETFEVQIISNGEIFYPGCLIEVEQDDKVNFMFKLNVENKGVKNLYVYVYDIGPCWQIQDIYCGSYVVIPGYQSMSKKLKTMVPPDMIEKGHRQCEDIIKVFVTSQPTSFDLLELPKLGEIVKDRTSRTSRASGSYASEDWTALNFPVRTYIK